jgi:hypothetical protein
MSAFESPQEFIINMLKVNGYSVRDGKMSGDDFRLFLIPPKFEIESEEIFKLKGNDIIHCGAVILLGGEMRDTFFQMNKETRDQFSEQIATETGVQDLDFFEIHDNGHDFKISIRAEFHLSKLSEDVFGDAMDRLNIAGGSIEDAINEYFGKLLGS